jgi:hypothetical protein
MGAAYRFNSEDTRNSPTLDLAKLLIHRGAGVVLHDPYVKPDDQKIAKYLLRNVFTRDMHQALASAEVAIFCTAHRDYIENLGAILNSGKTLAGVFDGCNLYRASDFAGQRLQYGGIGRGSNPPSRELVQSVHDGFRLMERGVANELQGFIDFANRHYAVGEFNRVDFKEVQRIAGTCVTGCSIVDPGPIDHRPELGGVVTRLVRCAYQAWNRGRQ